MTEKKKNYNLNRLKTFSQGNTISLSATRNQSSRLKIYISFICTSIAFQYDVYAI